MNRRDLLRGVVALPVAAAAASVGIKATPKPDLWARARLALEAQRAGIISVESALRAFDIEPYLVKLEEMMIDIPGLNRYMLGGHPDDWLGRYPETSGEAINNLVQSARVRELTDYPDMPDRGRELK